MYACRKHTSPIILRVSKSQIEGSTTATSYEITIQQLFQNVSDFRENVRGSKRGFCGIILCADPLTYNAEASSPSFVASGREPNAENLE